MVAARRRLPERRARLAGVGCRHPRHRAASRRDTPQTLRWTTRPAFTAELSCERENATRGLHPASGRCGCNSRRRSRGAAASRVVLIGPDDRRWTPGDADGPGLDRRGWCSGRPSPPPPTSASSCRPTCATTPDARLENAAAFPLAVRTDVEPPLAKFAARFGIVEAKADPTLPVTVRNLEPEATGQRAARRRPRRAHSRGRRARAGCAGWPTTPRTSSVFAGETDGVGACPSSCPRWPVTASPR